MVATVPDSIGVVVPVHNEEVLLGPCLDALAEATRRVLVSVEIVVVLDRCHDASELIARTHAEVTVLTSDRPGVGAARAAGFAHLLRGQRGEPDWLATTDADSTVPISWFERQLEHAAAGAEMVVGTVCVADWREHSDAIRDRYLTEYHAVPGHRHMHGANLSFRTDSYVEVGGFNHHESAEDVDLIGRFESAGCCLVWAADIPVVTSARRIGRAPSGFSSHLISLEEV